MNKIYAVHADLPTTTVWVNDAIFYNLEKESTAWVKCKLFGITCIKGRVPTFEIITSDGYVFSDVPSHMVRLQENPAEAQFDLPDLVYNNCLSEHFAISLFPELEQKTAFVLLKSLNQYVSAKYWFSLDFYQNNNWFHCMKLNNGQIAFIPSHKILFGAAGKLPDNHEFPRYKKLRHVFSV